MTDHHDRILDNINHLTQPYTHREPLTALAARLHGASSYIADHPSLLNQLRQAIHPGTHDTDPGLRLASVSQPPADTDALDALIRIESATAWWLKIEYRRSLRGSCEDNLRALVGASTEPHRTRDQTADLAADTSRWLTWARTEAGWQARPLTIPDPAPCCGHTHAIRVRRPDADHAWCTHCGQAWSEHHPDLPSVLLLEVALMERRGAA